MQRARRSIIDELAAFGPFFTVSVHEPADQPPPPWRLFTQLLHGPEMLGARVAAVRGRLVPDGRREIADLRVAVSVTQLGLVARVLAPALAAWALGSGDLRFDVGALWWQDQLGGPFPLSVARRDDDAPGSVSPLDAVGALTAQVARCYPISGRVLWGNVGSAANSAASLITARQPGLQGAAREAADTVLADPRIDGGQGRSGPDFRRRSCCLIYRLAPGTSAVCADCVLGGASRGAATS